MTRPSGRFLLVLTAALAAGPSASADEAWRRVTLGRAALEVPEGWTLVALPEVLGLTADARDPSAPRIALSDGSPADAAGGARVTDRQPLALGAATAEVVATVGDAGFGWHVALPEGAGTLSLTAPAEDWETVQPVFEHALATVEPVAEAPAVPDLGGAWLVGDRIRQVIPAEGGRWFRLGTPESGFDILRLGPDRVVAQPGPLGRGRIAQDGARIDWEDGSVWRRPRAATSVWQPDGEPVSLALSGLRGLRNGPDQPSRFSVVETARLDSLSTLHWNDGRGAAPGTIGLAGPDGAALGPWTAEDAAMPGNPPNVSWRVRPGLVLPPGDYTITDSDPATWTTGDEAGGRGMFALTMQPLRDAAPGPRLFPAPLGEIWQPLSTAGGDFDRFARLEGGRLRVSVPPGAGWGKTGIWSARPILDLRHGPAGLGFDLIPEETDSFVLSFGPSPSPEEWSGHLFRLSWSRSPDRTSGTATIHVGGVPVAQWLGGPTAPRRVEMRADPSGAVAFALDGRPIEARVPPAQLAQPLRVYALAHAPGEQMPARFALSGIDLLPPLPAAPRPTAWEPPGPDERVLFDGSLGLDWVTNALRGVDFARVAHFGPEGMRIDVPEGMVTGAAGIQSPDPLVWLDGFGPGAEVRVTFAVDPAATDGFMLALTEPGWGGTPGTWPGDPGARFIWLRRPDGTAQAEFHVTPHGETDFDRREMTGDAPAEVTFALRPGWVQVSGPGFAPFERPLDMARDGAGLRIYANSVASAENAATRFALKRITLARRPDPRPAPPPADAPIATPFAGRESDAWRPLGLAGGDFGAFAAWRDGALRIEVPPGHSWGKTGLLSDAPLLPADDRIRLAPWRIALRFDPTVPPNLAFALTPTRTEEMWPDHRGWFTFSYLPERDVWLMGLHVSMSQERTREIPGAWMARHWDGRLWIDVGVGWAAIAVPGGPRLASTAPFEAKMPLHATIVAHAPEENAPARLALREVATGFAVPPTLDPLEGWRLRDASAFTADGWLADVAATLPPAAGAAPRPAEP